MIATRFPLKINLPEIIYTEGSSTIFKSPNFIGYFRRSHAYHPGKTTRSKCRA